MAIPYKLYQDKREDSKTYNKWYARATYYDVTKTDKLASMIEAATTLTKPDVLACISAFLQYINQELIAGHRVVLDKFGSFRVGIRTKGADTLKEWSVTKNVKSMHIIFTPAVYTSPDHKRFKSLLTGATLKQYTGLELPDEEPTPPTP
jgi:predicted histone-like DNA-binding protein